MNIGLLAVDSNYPNLALMKISNFYKGKGDSVEWYNPFSSYDIVFMSKIFSFTPDYRQYITNTDIIKKGGTGYDIKECLDQKVEYIQPDYSIYHSIPENIAYGFLTRGCPNRCKWCVVPQKEGNVEPYMDIEEIAIDGRNNIILMDNNILASEHGLSQIEKIIKLKLKICEDADRSSSTSLKCRCSKAEVLEIQNLDGSRAGITEICSDYNKGFIYKVGETVEVKDFDKCRWNECSNGIHFFIDRNVAVAYIK